MPTLGPELVLPALNAAGNAFLTYTFTGESDDGEITLPAAQSLTPGTYVYAFERLAPAGDPEQNRAMFVMIAQQVEVEGGYVRGTHDVGTFTGQITVTQSDIDLYGDALTLSVTGNPTVANARDFSVRKINP